MRGKMPVAKIVPISIAPAPKRQLAGLYRGRVTFDDKALAPLTDEELVELGFENLLEGELVPSPSE